MTNKTLLATITAMMLGSLSVTAYAQTELRMSWWGGNARHQATLEALKRFQDQYPDIVVKGEYTGWDGHLSRLTTQVAGNTEPDVMQTNWNWLPIFSRDGRGFYDMNNQSDILQLNEFPTQAINMATIDGKVNGIPVSMTSRVFYYNQEIWSRAGVAYPTTWDDLLAAGRTFKEKLGNDHYPLVIEARDIFAMNRSLYIQKHGKDIINHQTNLLNLNEQEMIEFFQLYVDQINNHVFPSTREFSSYGKGNLYEMRPWIDGRFGGLYMWDTAVEKYADNLQPPMSLELGPYPMLPNAKDAGLLARPSMMFSIGRNTRHPEAAAKLVNFLLNDPQGIEALGLTRGIPMSQKGLSTLQAAGHIEKESLSFLGYEQAQQLPQVVLPTTYTDNAQLMELFSEEMQHLDYGKSNVEQAAKNFLRRGNRVLARMN
ncbi:MAG: ABC transporter substrate-binding protein [Vibrio metschnikovii]|uniref:ABC transporter substrate-binding protein n=1 Tax=Vibrio metschnikovii TaxID=28172 RepID=UPI0001B93D0E|nr:ABC transporter substrate-binding protein [Vibrio metschnikovii]EEX36140.1 periplasmic pectic oligomers binding protein [Vibrio metschnikovii CIP 69.14]MBC3619168.1 carbohydrate ABC transporter substrate-binding protein [Vibrio metschnikovii]MDM7486515.1 ABC transporter substrate-binding protein [Vibrio metschnikovii]SUP50186.1 periplasmic pectic oligomers binding protein [Vibrio metschnikovii]SUQ09871.1 periplasmic pectic oligomers binding protein [Vibrio metschnikovii]